MECTGITGNNEQLYQHYNWYELLVTNINTKFSDHHKIHKSKNTQKTIHRYLSSTWSTLHGCLSKETFIEYFSFLHWTKSI